MTSGISFSLGGSVLKATPGRPPTKSSPASTNGIKRPHAALHDDDDSEDENAANHSITHFDKAAGGAFDVSRPKVVKQALIIKPQANRDWKEASQRNKRQRYGIPEREQDQDQRQSGADLAERQEEDKKTYGLDVRKEAIAARQGTNGGATAAQSHAAGTDADITTAPAPAPAPVEFKTDEQRAIDALNGIKHESELVLPAVSEEEAFLRDARDAPAMATLEEYQAVPVEQFGAAMLRGMGWKEGQGIGSQRGKKFAQAKVPERRPALLGIGAKADAAVAAELGAWGQGAQGKKRRPDIMYNPLTLRNKVTGEQLTEDELKRKMEEQTARDEERQAAARRSPERRDKSHGRRRRHDEDYDSDEAYERKRRENRREKDYDSKPRSSRRDRSASYDQRQEPRHNRDYDERRDKERRRDRDDRERGHSRRERYDDDRDRKARR